MSVLLACLPQDVAEATIKRLVAQEDEVRVIVVDRYLVDHYRTLGAYIASGEADDPDLVERAAQNVRTLVVGDEGLAPETLEGLIKGAAGAGVGRLIYCSPAPSEAVTRVLREGTGEYVVLRTGKRGLLRKAGVTPEIVAESVDAADDLQGPLRSELDLTDPSSRKALKLER